MAVNKNLYITYTSPLDKQKQESDLMWRRLSIIGNRDKKRGKDNEFMINKKAVAKSPLEKNCYEDINDTDINEVGKF